MEVVLTQDVKSLGKKGDIVKVNEGYARNFLIPKGLAVVATEGVKTQIKQQKKAEEKREEQKRAEAQALANKLKGQSVTVKAKAGEKGRIFGSITAGDVADALNKQFNLDIDKKKIQMDAVKELGTFEAKIKLYPEISTEIKVVVTAE
ncbi:MAG: 50S ribosomal protein L9 [Bacillota bacterium]|jgi:large subunit ribosomal protein L9|nr:50S ribosomal protein L9 [Bacillota bacterium]NLU53928.1 50S ribosomal protein L9 [Bacillota bacterium]HOA91573.1 50S ribosomal protein L9 [Bacillota bacterium]HOL13721.1 50S ribosomal protein L9 [Bacillota bacterium]HOP53568.1 50S ribosomal protein L9 [Bacillota bacterium]